MKNATLSPDFTTILSLRIPRLTATDARAHLSNLLKREGACAKVYTPNPQMALGVSRSPALAALFDRADLLLPDGIGLIIASHLLRKPLPERITGIDTARYVLQFAERHGLSVALLGAKNGVAERAAECLRHELPHLRICYTHHGYFSRDGKENDAILDGLRQTAPDILFVCFGFPEQEKWIDRYAATIPSLRLCMGLGGSLDVWAGETSRAPMWIGKCGLEWLWRVLREPRRARVFYEIPAFLFLVFRQKQSRAATDHK